MGLDPRIALATTVPDLGRTFSNILTNVAKFDAIKENRETQPFRMQALQDVEAQRGLTSQVTQEQLMQAKIANTSSRDKMRIASIAPFAESIIPNLQAGNFEAVKQSVSRRLVQLQEKKDRGEIVDLTETSQLMDILNTNPEQALPVAQAAASLGMALNPNNRIQSSQFIPGKGFATITAGGETGFSDIGGLGETTQQKSQREQSQKIKLEQTKSKLKGKSEAVKVAINRGAKVFDSIEPVGAAIANYDDAIAELDAGAETGVITSMMPSFRTASIKLDNIKKRLGLDVVGNTTFGALSESELKFALDSALPDNLQPAELKEWLIAKRDAQKKVKERLEEAASFLSDGTHTIKDWIEFDTARQLNFKNGQQPQQPQSIDLTAMSDEDLLKLKAQQDQ